MTKECAWSLHHPLERDYHDSEWGVPVYDDRILFEFITLEGAQAGLSWLTVLKRRDAYRQAFVDYQLEQIVDFDEQDIERIMTDYDVIKHRKKLQSVVSNAQAALTLQREWGSLSHALWQFVDHQPIVNHWTTACQVPTATPESKAMSVFLKKAGFRFVGETICYAFMQAMGMVNDHLVSCPCRKKS
ncbi:MULTISPECIES: DNA-3-methyladenine glycosylase I [unclassified Vibrio]|uniref:DNA-3-methyladenine glycosylase I n=1 Tax=Vibrio sp. HB236076 TaxID=3232307 RepID=A0AB39HC68_9VIBR|nr:DNA-3-methyladenine glycosylase I [Vibrio sp. HB161653]MDP5253616.1 DNA-3-methyladenine glycosylase I [Vibrio sp. HB161653]